MPRHPRRMEAAANHSVSPEASEVFGVSGREVRWAWLRTACDATTWSATLEKMLRQRKHGWLRSPKSKIETTKIRFERWFGYGILLFRVNMRSLWCPPCLSARHSMVSRSWRSCPMRSLNSSGPHVFVDKSKVESPKTSDVKSRDTFAWRYSCEIL